MIVLACSATGGHVYPAIAVKEHLDLGANATCFIIDKGRISEDILRAYGYRYLGLNFRRNKLLALVLNFFKMIAFFYKESPTLVLGFGGITSFPVVLVAKLFRVKVILFEQNAVIGRTNRVLSRFVHELWLSYKACNLSKCRQERLLGNPVRKSFNTSNVDQAIFELPFKSGNTCFVFGGSQGALHLNGFIAASYGWFAEQNIQLIHVLGDRDYVKKYESGDYQVVKNDQGEVIRVEARFINDMKQAYLWADRVISRAGGTTIAELIHFQKTALLIPYSYATDNHQFYNAKEFCDNGYGQLVLEKELSINHIDQFFKTTFKPQVKHFSYFNSWKEKLDQELV